MTDMGSGGVLNSFFLQISGLSYGIYIWMLACILFWAVDKKCGSLLLFLGELPDDVFGADPSHGWSIRSAFPDWRVPAQKKGEGFPPCLEKTVLHLENEKLSETKSSFRQLFASPFIKDLMWKERIA